VSLFLGRTGSWGRWGREFKIEILLEPDNKYERTWVSSLLFLFCFLFCFFLVLLTIFFIPSQSRAARPSRLGSGGAPLPVPGRGS
jgi:hypothetical protein